jgi:molybdate transport system substrate-binding protein
MKARLAYFKLLFLLVLLIPFEQTAADQIRVAVASNFTTTMNRIAEQFEINTEHTVTLISGSTGKHYAQIINGAPYDVFFAADAIRPQLLEQEEKAIANTRFTYALGKIVLWSPQEGFVDANATILGEDNFRFLAIANPKLAPYGKAAQEILEYRGLWDQLQKSMVRGENIAQTFQFIQSGNAQLGFIALSQVSQANQDIKGSFWQVPQRLYTPIQQQAILLKENGAAQSFIDFVQSNEVKALIRRQGYDTP